MSPNARKFSALFLGAMSVLLVGQKAQAVEGGIGGYFLGSRDTLAAVVPPPGTYLSFIYDRLEGSVQGLSLAGIPIRADADVAVNLYRLSATFVPDASLWGGTPAINIAIPLPDTNLAFTTVTGPIAGANIEDNSFGVGDIGVTGLVGWHQENLHYNVGFTAFAPTGSYSTASVDIPNRTINVLSNSKNVWSFMPSAGVTYLNPQTGFEVSGVASLLASTRNTATDYQTAPAVQLEGAVMQRFPSNWGVGLTGYTYQQIGDDGGAGADAMRQSIGTSDLRASVSGVGPIITYSGGTFLGGDTTLKLKYTHEFDGKRRFESRIFTVNLSVAF